MKAFFASLTLMLLASSALAFDYVDSRGFRHWNHYGDAKTSAPKEVVQNPNKPQVEIVQDTVKFRPIDEPATEQE